jgi:predicted ATPase with chaperone activity
VAQTIADLAEAEIVSENHVSEALSLRAGQSVVVA